MLETYSYFYTVPLPKRRLTTSNASFTFTPASGKAVTVPLTAGQQPHTQAWASNSTDLTPSLCSDNEQEAGNATTEERSPTTPPPILRIEPIPMKSKLPLRVEVIDVDMLPEKQRAPAKKSQPTAKRQEEKKRPPPAKAQAKAADVFSKRPPRSPLVPTPKKPKRPARPRVVPVKLPAPARDEQEDELPEPYSGLEEDPRPPAPPVPPTRLRKPTSFTDAKARKARRKTLDEEIRTAEDDGSLDSGVIVGVGSRSKKKGFLAGGGAAGVPVFMGVGYIEGAEDSGEDERRLLRASAGSGARRRR